MVDPNVEISMQDTQQEEATDLEVILYVVGILSIPVVPILMATFLTPWSGM